MHTKMRLFDWVEGGQSRSLLITGSLNPDGSAPFNDETLLVIADPAVIAQYRLVYQAVLTLSAAPRSLTFSSPPLTLPLAAAAPTSRPT